MKLLSIKEIKNNYFKYNHLFKNSTYDQMPCNGTYTIAVTLFQTSSIIILLLQPKALLFLSM